MRIAREAPQTVVIRRSLLQSVARLRISAEALFFWAVLLMVAGAPLSMKLGGRLALSNLAHMGAILLVTPLILRYAALRVATVLSLFWGMVGIAGMFILARYGVAPKLSHLVFFTVAIATVLTCQALFEADAKFADAAVKAVRLTILPMLAYLALYALLNIGTDGLIMLSYGFDDKSHAVFLCWFYGVIALQSKKAVTGIIVSLGFALLSLLTLSRIVVFFLPFYFPLLLWNMQRAATESQLRSPGARNLLRIGLVVLCIGLVVLAGQFVAQNPHLFQILDRLKSIDGAVQSDSTIAHVLLIAYAVELKMSNLSNLVFGITPGAFSAVLTHSDIDIAPFLRTDPEAAEVVMQGEAPMHSTHLSVFTEWPLPFFIVYVALWIWLGVSLLRSRRWTEVAFVVPFLLGTTFYSTHNEVLFYVILIYLMARVTRPAVLLQWRKGRISG